MCCSGKFSNAILVAQISQVKQMLLVLFFNSVLPPYTLAFFYSILQDNDIVQCLYGWFSAVSTYPWLIKNFVPKLFKVPPDNYFQHPGLV